MSAREEAAAKVIADTYGQDNATERTAAAALTAAHAVMFSEEAVDRAAKALCAAEFPEVSPAYAWNVQFEDGQRHYREMAHAVIAELRAES